MKRRLLGNKVCGFQEGPTVLSGPGAESHTGLRLAGHFVVRSKSNGTENAACWESRPWPSSRIRFGLTGRLPTILFATGLGSRRGWIGERSFGCVGSRTRAVLPHPGPGANGVNVLRRVRDKGLMTRVAVCIGSVDLGCLKAAAELRPDDMLPKPVNLPEVWSESCEVCGV